MGRIEFQFPIQGKDTNNPVEKQPLLTSPDLENVRPQDVMEKRLRGGQRPAVRKWGSGRIGGGDYRIDKLVAGSRGTMPDDCPTQPDCESQDYYWWDDACHEFPPLPGLTLPASVWKCLEDSDKASVVWSYDTGGWARALRVDGSGNVYIGGERSGNKSIWKLNSFGVLQWSYDTGNTIWAIEIDGSGNVFACGAQGTDEDSDTAAVWKLDTDGAKQWEYDIDSIQTGIGIDSSGNVWVAGLLGIDEDGDDKRIRKLNSAGIKQLDIEGADNFNRLKIDSADGIYTPSTNDSLYKWDTSGNAVWSYDVGGACDGVAIDSNNNVFPISWLGTDEDGGRGSVRKLNSSGVKQWGKGTGINTRAHNADVDGSDNIYVNGYHPLKTYSLWKFANNSTFQWQDGTGDTLLNTQHDGTYIYIVGHRIT